MKQDLLKKENAKLKKKIKSLTIEKDSLEAELRLCYESRDISSYRSEMLNDLGLDLTSKLRKYKGTGKHYRKENLLACIEILRRYELEKRKFKPKAKDFVAKYNKDNEQNKKGIKIKVRTFNSFLDKIERDTSIYSEISNAFYEEKTNEQILTILKKKLHFNVKV